MQTTFVIRQTDLGQLAEKRPGRVPATLLELPGQLTIKQGITLIVGSNGSGKSTLLSAFDYAATTVIDKVPYKEIWAKMSDLRHRVETYKFGIAEAISVQTTHTGVVLIDYSKSPKDIGQSTPFGTSHKETRMSQRESRDAMYTSTIQKSWLQDQEALVLLDEFEMGLDAWRHLEIERLLGELVHPDSTIIAATNSPILVCETDLPRIDLRFPQRGLHRPSQY